jgi:hypothetical protein
MPLARIDLVQGKSAEYRRTIGTIVYEAMVDGAQERSFSDYRRASG